MLAILQNSSHLRAALLYSSVAMHWHGSSVACHGVSQQTGHQHIPTSKVYPRHNAALPVDPELELQLPMPLVQCLPQPIIHFPTAYPVCKKVQDASITADPQ